MPSEQIPLQLQRTDAASQPLLHEHDHESIDDDHHANQQFTNRQRKPFTTTSIPKPSLRQLKIVLPIFSLILILAFAHHTVPKEDVAWTIQYGQEKLGLHACSGWDPDGPPEDDPPDCLRATQWREVENILKEDRTLRDIATEVYPHNLQAIARFKMCLRNEIKCPARPIIISGWWYMTESVWEHGGTTGEVIWMKSVIQQFEEVGYLLIGTRDYKTMVRLARLMPTSYHQVWAEDINVVSCTTDPRCIAPEHYQPPRNASSIVDPSDPIPEEELGVIPIWRLHSADYWGARPTTVANTDHYWGRPRNDPTEWSFNPLGAEWSVVPFKYPKHAFLPFSIEKICTKVPWVKHTDRKDTALIYAKKSSYFWNNGRHTPPAFWSELASNMTLNFVSTAKIDPPLNCAVPEGITDIGMQTRIEYEKLVSSVKVLVGIGLPTVSPSVYTALCQGTPVVLPYFKEDPTPPGWPLFSDWWSQHGPALSLGEPYVYGYRLNDKDDLREKIFKATSTPIRRFIPPDMKWDAAVAAVKRYLAQDWEAKFNQVVLANGGEVPRMEPNVRERCFELKRCRYIEPAPREGKTYSALTGTWS